MKYYDKNGNLVEFKNYEYLNQGGCASVLYNVKKQLILKKYFDIICPEDRIQEKMFNLLKCIKNPHFIELYDIYCHFSLKEYPERNFHIDAYSARYYPDDSLNVLYENKDYLLDNIRELDELFSVFSSNLIITNDIKRKNLLVGKENIVIVDPDLFHFGNPINDAENPLYIIEIINKNNLVDIFRFVLASCFENDENYLENVLYIDRELTNFDVSNDTDIAYELSLKLKNVNKPIELFNR